ncbi:NAD(P)/FAD-dependent oxidoreductase [Streptomyces atroolivaceus]|uniref:NAD(P)/FAD-dependent oxidoreductase n=1 Tax=Streptomyces atroolivaceus TaxID=66869 RepID=UPI00362FC1E4
METDEGASADDHQAQVIVVGAGPAGVDVLLLEKGTFPRDKVCGDGLTPRGVQQLVRMGVDIDAPGWMRTKGMRWVCGGRQVHIDWPRSGSHPDFGLTRSRRDFDDILVRQAVAAGARLLLETKATGPLTDRAGRITGVSAVTGADQQPRNYHASVVIAADGTSARTALAMGLERDPSRPVATAARRYYRSDARTHVPLLNRRVMASPTLVHALARLLTHGTDAPSGDLIDTVVRGLVRMVPAPRRHAGGLGVRRR